MSLEALRTSARSSAAGCDASISRSNRPAGAPPRNY